MNEFQVVSIPDSFLFTGFLDKIFQSQSHHKGLNSNKILSISVSASFPLYSPHLKESARFSKIYLGYMSWVGSIRSYFHIFLSLSLDLSSPFPPSLPPFLPSFFLFFFPTNILSIGPSERSELISLSLNSSVWIGVSSGISSYLMDRNDYFSFEGQFFPTALSSQ